MPHSRDRAGQRRPHHRGDVATREQRGQAPGPEEAALTGAAFSLEPIPRPRGERLRELLIAALVFSISFAAYRSSPRQLATGDTESTRRLPFALLGSGSADLSGDPFFQTEPLPYSALRKDGRIVPAFPAGTALLATPAALLFPHDRSPDDSTVLAFEKTAAALIASFTALFFFLALSPRFGRRNSILATLVFAFGTSQFATASQGLWPFTGELFFLVAALAIAGKTRAEGPAAGPLAAGLALSAAFLCRPTALLFFPVLAVALELRPRRLAWLATSTVIGLGAALSLQKVLLGSWLGPYVEINRAEGMWGFDPWEALSGVLFSPSRGLLPFFPYVLAAAGVLLRNRTKTQHPFWRAALAYGLLAPAILAAGYAKWWGGDGLGPRLLTEASPFLAWITVEAWTVCRSRTARGFLAFLVLFSVSTQFLLVFRSSGMAWNGAVRPDENPGRLFSLRDSQLAAVWLPAWRPSPELIQTEKEDPGLSGSLDSPAAGQEVSGVLVLRGWARIPGEDLTVEAWINGAPAEDALTVRHARPDVASALPGLGDCSRAGYEIRIPRPLTRPGKARLVVVFRTRDGRVRHYPQVVLRWRP